MQIRAETRIHSLWTRTVRAAVLASVVAVVLALSAKVTLAADASVNITDQNRFVPQTISIQVGQTVTWINGSAAVHTVTDDPNLAANPSDASVPKDGSAFNSGFLKSKDVYKHRFTAPGTYHYFCLLHEGLGMVGTVVVKP